MFNVSQNYITQVKKPVKVRHLHGVLANIAFDADDVVLDSFSITNQCSDSGRFEIGGVYSAELNITFTKKFISENWVQTDTNYWKRKVIQIFVDLEVQGESGEIPCSVFRVSDISSDNGGFHIVGYDLMGRFERKLRFTSTVGKPYDYLVNACNNSNMTFGMTESEVDALPNGTDIISPWKDHEMKTYRDLISAIAEYCGCFATIDRTGNLVLRHFNAGSNPSTWSYTDDDVRNGINTSEFYRRYNTVIGESKTLDETLSSVTVYEDDEVVDIGVNPFMQSYNKTTFESKLWNISLGLPKDWHTPCSFSTSQDYCIDLGDKITLPNGDTAYVMSYEFTMQGITIQCFGEDNDASSTSSGGSDSSGIGKGSEMSIVSFENIRDIELGSDWSEVASLNFYSAKEQIVLLNGIVKEDSLHDGSVEFKYELDGEPLPFNHVEHVFEGNDTQSLIYGISAPSASYSNVKVYMRMRNTNAVVRSGDLSIYLTGVGLMTSDWGGMLELKDVVQLSEIKYSPVVLRELADVMSSDLVTPIAVSASDTTDTESYIPYELGNTADYVIITIGEPNPNNLVFAGETYSGEDISTGLI